jgi:predicted N-acetyltransferase YhbS
MQTRCRHYDHAVDYQRIGRFLVRTYRTAGGHINWLQPRWEYMHYHPLVRRVDLNSIGVWETHDRIVGVVHPEHSMGTAYFEIDPEYEALKRDMLRYAEGHLSTMDGGVRRLDVLIGDHDDDFAGVAAEMGYTKSRDGESMTNLAIPDPFPAVVVAAGFQLKTLAENNDLRKVDRALWRGFGHGDEPPEDGIGDREFMQSALNFRKDLNIVVEAPDGNFVAYCGMWYEPVHAVAYVEPVATDPNHRRMGLGRAAVMEGVRRAGEAGAKVAWVGSAQPFYLSLGFRHGYSSSFWQREWPA